MRKIFLNGIITALISVFLCGAAVHAENVQNEEFLKRCEQLYNLGILSSSDLDGSSYVTRAEFASAAVRLRGAENFAAADGVYTDMNNKHPYYKDVMAASAIGLVNGGEDGSFMPDEPITSEQAAVILIRTLGYSDADAVQENRDYYIAWSGVLCGYGEMNWNSVSDILTKMLDRNVLVYSFKNGRGGYTQADETLLEKYRSLYKFDGIVQGVHDTYIGGQLELGKNQAEIDGVKYETGEMDLSGYVGHRVKGYYYDDKDLGTYTIVTAEDYKTTVLTIRADDIESYENHQLGYFADSKTRYARTDINLGIIYNGRYADLTADEMLIKSGSITLIDNDNDGTYEAANVSEYRTYIVDSVDLQNKKIYLQYADEKYTIDLKKDSDIVEFSDISGKPIDIREIMRGDVLCVYESKSGEYVGIVLCSKELEGTVSSASSDFAVIDGTRYNVTESCLKNQSAYIKPGVKGVFVRDVNGDICYIVTSDSGDYFAYVINCGYEEGKDELFLKLLLENGDIKSYYVRDRAKLDSVAYKSKEKLWDAMGGRSFRHRLIKCAVSDNEIIKLETAGSNVKNGGFEMYYTDYDYKDGMPMPNSDNHKRTFRSASMTIGGKVALSGNTIIMIAPNDPEEMSDKYYAVDNTYIKDDKDYRVEAYRDNDSGYTADVLVIYDDVSSNIELTDNDIGISVIGGIIDAADEDDELTYMIEVYNGGVMEQYMLREKDMLSKVYGNYTPAKGDIIRYELKDEKINKMELIYSVQAGKIVAPPNRTNETNTNHYQQFRVWDAYVFYRWGSFMMLSETEPTDPKNYNYRDYDIHPCAASSIVICEQGKSMEVYGGTADDIIGYKNTNGAECSKVVVYERWGDGKSIVVYR